VLVTKKGRTMTTTTDKYRFINGALFELDLEKNAYVCVFSGIYYETKAEAIEAYERVREEAK
jgi:hypothetical protein